MTFWLWLLIGVALIDAFIVFALCRAASLSERATFNTNVEATGDLSDYLAGVEAKVHRMEFRRLSRDVERWRASL